MAKVRGIRPGVDAYSAGLAALMDGLIERKQAGYVRWYDRPESEGGAREKQRPPEWAWRYWLLLAGRGFGKSRAGSEWVQYIAETSPGALIGLIGPTAADVRDVMVEGESGILAIAPAHMRPVYEPSKRKLTWPNGSKAITFSADKPSRLRGPQHTHIWADEIATWRDPSAWDMALLGLRLGANPQALITTTPRPIPLLKAMVKDPLTHVTRGTTYENRRNLAESFFDEIIKQYEGTRLGEQELNAKILEDVDGALWTSEMIDAFRVKVAPEMDRIVIGVDPKISASADSETGIVVVGAGRDEGISPGKEKAFRRGYVLGDLSTGGSPEQWGRAVVEAYYKYRADVVAVEVNQGGDLVVQNIRNIDEGIPIKRVTATRGKRLRAEPIVSLYEQGRVHHVGMYSRLEDQMLGWVPGDNSPDRLDALVWALTLLFEKKQFGFASVSKSLIAGAKRR